METSGFVSRGVKAKRRRDIRWRSSSAIRLRRFPVNAKSDPGENISHLSALAYSRPADYPEFIQSSRTADALSRLLPAGTLTRALCFHVPLVWVKCSRVYRCQIGKVLDAPRSGPGSTFFRQSPLELRAALNRGSSRRILWSLRRSPAPVNIH